MFTSLGWALGPLAGAHLAASLGLRAPFVLMGVIQGVAVLLVKGFIRPDAERARAREK
jgi:MFS family permease